MVYMLRVVIFEERWERQLDDIVALCRRAGIDEVLLMEQSHQILMVPYTIEKHLRMAEIYCKIAERLRKEGIIPSVNIATIVGHIDAPLTGERVFPFRKFVGENLKESNACYCILDEDWQDYAASVCGIYAVCRPDKIFIDDDFRSLNHSAEIGCFCPLHASKTSAVCGIELDQAGLLKRVYGSSETDMKIRSAWMKVNFDGQLEAAGKMRTAVEKISPCTRLGLMNSGEPGHSVQGRDMDKLLLMFSGNTRRPLSRPAGGGYSDVLHDGVFQMHQMMSLSMSVINSNVQVTSEVENWPHTRLTKSMNSTRLQMEIHALAGAENLTLNIFDYMATPYSQEPDFISLLEVEKERLELIKEARKGKKAKGIGLLWKKNTAEATRIRNGKISEIIPDRKIDCIMAQFGIPTQFELSKGNLIFGDAIDCYSDSEIRMLLKGGLMIDGIALEHLCRRGFSELVGCRPQGYIREPSVELLTDKEFCGSFAGNLLPTGWFIAEQTSRYTINLKLSEGTRTLSVILDEEMKELAPGMVLFENELGGRIAVAAVPVDSWQWLYRSKAYQIGKIAEWLMYGDIPLRIEDSPNIGPFYYEDEAMGTGLLGIVNAGLDEAEAVIRTNLEIKDLFTGIKEQSPIRVKPLSVRFFSTLNR